MKTRAIEATYYCYAEFPLLQICSSFLVNIILLTTIIQQPYLAFDMFYPH